MENNYIEQVLRPYEKIDLLVCLTHNLDPEFNEIFDYIRSSNIRKSAIFYHSGEYERSKCFKGRVFKNQSRHRLHSKILFFKYRQQAGIKYRVVITSANLTRAGYCKNLEVLWTRDEMDRSSPIVRAVASYLVKYIRDSGHANRKHAQDILQELERLGTSKSVLARQLVINGEDNIEEKVKKAKEIIVVSPFFYGQNSAENFKFMQQLLKPAQKVIIITRYCSDGVPISPDFVKLMKNNLRVYMLESRNLHGKMYLFKCADNTRGMLIGSSNFTPGGIYKNYEANVLINKLSGRDIIKILSLPRGRRKGKFLGENIIPVENFGKYLKETHEERHKQLDKYKECLFQNLVWEATIAENSQELDIEFNGSKIFNRIKSPFITIKITNKRSEKNIVLTKNKSVKQIKLLIGDEVDIDEPTEFNVLAKVKGIKQDIALIVSIQADEYVCKNSALQLLSLIQGNEIVKKGLGRGHRRKDKEAKTERGDDITSGIDYIIKIGNLLAKIRQAEQMTGEQRAKLEKLNEYLQDPGNQPDKKLGKFLPVIKAEIVRYLKEDEKTAF